MKTYRYSVTAYLLRPLVELTLGVLIIVGLLGIAARFEWALWLRGIGLFSVRLFALGVVYLAWGCLIARCCYFVVDSIGITYHRFGRISQQLAWDDIHAVIDVPGWFRANTIAYEFWVLPHQGVPHEKKTALIISGTVKHHTQLLRDIVSAVQSRLAVSPHVSELLQR